MRTCKIFMRLQLRLPSHFTCMMPGCSPVQAFYSDYFASKCRYGGMRVVIIICLLLTCLVGGCTINFKGKDVELDGTIVHRYELDNIEILKGQAAEPGGEEFAWTESQTPGL